MGHLKLAHICPPLHLSYIGEMHFLGYDNPSQIRIKSSAALVQHVMKWRFDTASLSFLPLPSLQVYLTLCGDISIEPSPLTLLASQHSPPPPRFSAVSLFTGISLPLSQSFIPSLPLCSALSLFIMKSSFHYAHTLSLCPGVREFLFPPYQVLCAPPSIICTL